MKSGFVGLIGRPNVGKSTLLNNILGKKIAITSDKPQTTRNIIKGIYNDDESQIVFVDTPGIHKPQNKLGRILNEQAYYSISDVDLVLFVPPTVSGTLVERFAEKFASVIRVPLSKCLTKTRETQAQKIFHNA